MNFNHLLDAVPDSNKKYATPYFSILENTIKHTSVNTPLRIVHFLAQLAHESGWFKYKEENLNYSAKALRSVFGKYFPTDELANQYARKPEKIANRVYANRMSNGNEESGDGWRYRGRGLIQLTGKSNYTDFKTDKGIDVIAQPERLTDPDVALEAAIWFWKKRGLNQFADEDDILTITKRINGGTNGLDHRKHCLNSFKQIMHAQLI